MLSKCDALIYAADGKWFENLNAVLHSAGFNHVSRVGAPRKAMAARDQNPVCFYFFSQENPIEQLRNSVHAIRHGQKSKRFSPLILMASDLSRKQLDGYIGLGFDDIIRFPCSLTNLGERIKRQMGSPVKYYETDTFFGPDRRRFSSPGLAAKMEKRAGQTPYRRHLIRRDAFKGVSVLEVYDHVPDIYPVSGEALGA